MVVLEVSGDGANAAFKEEPGGHRWQRVPSTEKRGRVQTSTITVAVLPLVDSKSFVLDEKDLTWTAFRGSGAGGQKRNKTASAVRVVHNPTGIAVRYETERSQHANLTIAREILAARIRKAAEDKSQQEEALSRKTQVGVGARGDKRRTIRLQADQVVDHLTGKTMTAKKYLKGELETLLKS